MKDSSQGAVVAVSVRMVLGSDAVHNRQSRGKLPSRLGYV